jgi:hypothetical protein
LTLFEKKDVNVNERRIKKSVSNGSEVHPIKNGSVLPQIEPKACKKTLAMLGDNKTLLPPKKFFRGAIAPSRPLAGPSMVETRRGLLDSPTPSPSPSPSKDY